jgi:hypothetical protein
MVLITLFLELIRVEWPFLAREDYWYSYRQSRVILFILQCPYQLLDKWAEKSRNKHHFNMSLVSSQTCAKSFISINDPNIIIIRFQQLFTFIHLSFKSMHLSSLAEVNLYHYMHGIIYHSIIVLQYLLWNMWQLWQLCIKNIFNCDYIYRQLDIVERTPVNTTHEIKNTIVTIVTYFTRDTEAQ